MGISISAKSARGDLASIVLAYGFRPFFLAAAAWAIVAMMLWGAAMAGALPDWLGAVDLAWHQHEMLFGVFGAAVVGFVLTAFPEWTKASPLVGRALGWLVGLWLAARVVMLSGVARPDAVLLGAAFLPVLAIVAIRVLIEKRPPRLGLFVLLITSYAALSVTWQLARAGLIGVEPMALGLPSLLVIIAMVSVAAGRIVPVVSQLALRSDASNRRLLAEPASTDVAAWALVLLVVLVLLQAASAIIGWVAYAAAAAQAHRLAEWWIGWAGRRAYVWPFHLSSLMITGALAAIGYDRLGGSVPSTSLAHALGLGGAALATLAVMTIAGLLHTGYPLAIPWTGVCAMAFMAMAAALRVAAPWLDGPWSGQAIELSGSVWIAAFLLYLGAVGPKLVRARIDGKPG